MPVGDILNEVVGDLEESGRLIRYPLSDANLKSLRFMFDFHIKKQDCRWVYVDSSNTTRRWGRHKTATENGGGRWRIIESATAKIVEEGGNLDV
jgi:hypothetical protein